MSLSTPAEATPFHLVGYTWGSGRLELLWRAWPTGDASARTAEPAGETLRWAIARGAVLDLAAVRPEMPGHTYWLRLTLLTDDLFRTLTARFLRPAALVTPAGNSGLPVLRLCGMTFDVAELVAMAPDAPRPAGGVPEAWAGYDTYEALIARAAALTPNSPESHSITLEFRSPTAFSDGQKSWGKRMHLFPDPDRVFDRLARVWNAWAPSTLTLDLRAVDTYVDEWVAVANFDLHTRLLHFDRHSQLGFCGRCVYVLMDQDRQRTMSEPALVGADLSVAQALHLLASFAFYAGIGQKTTMGMGQAREAREVREVREARQVPRSSPSRSDVPSPEASGSRFPQREPSGV